MFHLILHFLMFHLDPEVLPRPLGSRSTIPPLDPEVPIEIVFKKEIFVVFNIIGFGVFK
jgi:hypothetical protein